MKIAAELGRILVDASKRRKEVRGPVGSFYLFFSSPAAESLYASAPLMRLVWIIFVLVPMLLPPCGAGAADESGLALRRTDASSLTPTLLPFGGRGVTLSLRNTSFTGMTGGSRLHALAPDPQSPRANGIQASSSLLHGKLTAETEVWQREQTMFEPQYVDRRQGQMTRLALTGIQGPFRYGATYRSSDKHYVDQPDQTLREIWGEWRHGAVKIRSAFGEARQNPDRDVSRSSAVRTYERLGLVLARPLLPEFTLTYVRSSWAHAPDGPSVRQRLQTDSVEGALSYAAATWQARLSSSYFTAAGGTSGTGASTGLAEFLTAIYRPVDALTVSPSVGYRADYQQWSGVRVDQPTASVTLSYRASQRLLLSALGGYGVARSADYSVDRDSVNGKGWLTWTFPSALSFLGNTSLGFEASYHRTGNRAHATTDVEDISGLLRLVVPSF